MSCIDWDIVTNHHDTVIIVGSGPSLTGFDFDSLLGHGAVIAINDAGNHIPFADYWFTVDPWGLGTTQIPANFRGEIWAAVPEDFGCQHAKYTDHRLKPSRMIHYLHRDGFEHDPHNYNRGLNESPDHIHSGNSGYGALNFAYHMKPKHIILLGIDANHGYFYDNEKNTRPLNHLPQLFNSAVPQLLNKKIKVINGSEFSAIKCFDRYNLDDVMEKLHHWSSDVK